LGSQACSFRSQHVLLKIVKWCMSKHGKSQCVRDGAGGRCPGRERRQLCKGHPRPMGWSVLKGRNGEIWGECRATEQGGGSSQPSWQAFTGELTAALGSSQQTWGAHSSAGELTGEPRSSQHHSQRSCHDAPSSLWAPALLRRSRQERCILRSRPALRWEKG